MQRSVTPTAKMSQLLLLALAVACSSDQVGPDQTLDVTPASMVIVSGEQQSAQAGSDLANPLVVRVTNESGRAIANQIVNFRVTAGGGSVFAGTALTNVEGVAQERWTLGTKAGEAQTVEARAVDNTTGAKLVFATFHATALSSNELPARVVLSPSSVKIEEGRTQQFTVRAEDAGGSTLAARTTSWASSDTTVAVVDAKGLVRARAKGSASIRATVDGRTGTAALSVTATEPTTPTEPPTPPVEEPPPPAPTALDRECASPQAGWIWCDDFESDRLARYFEYDQQNGSFARTASVGVNGTSAMRARFTAGQTNAGSLKLAFGRTPDSYMRPVDAGTANHREIYWRFYLRNAAGWTGGGGDKLARAVVFGASNWAEAAIGHIWSSGSGGNYLSADPASGTDAGGTLRTTHYNDFDHLRWLGATTGRTALFDASHVNQWYCVESRMRLNDAGQSNGVLEFWVDGTLEARSANLNWLGSFNAYGINAVFIENYWNSGSPRAQDRFIDNLVVSTSRIGCGVPPVGGASSEPPPPTEPVAPTVSSVVLTPTSDTVPVGASVQFRAAVRDANGGAISGKTITWRTASSAVATVNTSGVVTGRAAGTTDVTATVDGVTATARVTVRAATPTTATVSVSPTSATLEVGATRQLTASAHDGSGNPVTGRTFTWSSSSTSVATVSAAGLVTARAAGTATITATADGRSGTARITVEAPEPVVPVVASVAVSPGSVSLTVGGTRQFSATARDASGGTLAGTATWSSSNQSVATVSSSGLVTARAAGSATISATVEGRTGSGSVTVSAPVVTPPPPTSGGSVTPLMVEDFSGYSSVAALQGSARWQPIEGKGVDRIAIDRSVGYGASDRSMRYDWPNNGSTCRDYSIKPGILQFPARQHVWIEFVVRFKSNFRVNSGASGCASEYKLAAAGSYGGIGRWNIPEMQAGQWVVGYPDQVFGVGSGGIAPSRLWDDQPHVFRVEMKVGSGGILRFWVDGVLVDERTGFTTASSHPDIDNFSPGLNLNQGPNIDGMQMWWHKITVYDTDPGWR